jgi:hypothetical protein
MLQSVRQFRLKLTHVFNIHCVIFIILSITDLYLSYTVLKGPELEFNPIMKYVWSMGFEYVTLVKVIVTGFGIYALSLLYKTRVLLSIMVITIMNWILCCVVGALFALQ